MKGKYNMTFLYFISTFMVCIKHYCYKVGRRALWMGFLAMFFLGLLTFMYKTSTKPHVFARNRHNIYVTFNGRLGNHMFQFSSLLGIAQKNNMTALVPKGTSLWHVFKLGCYTQDGINLKGTTPPEVFRTDCRHGTEHDLINPKEFRDTSAGIYRTWYNDLKEDTLIHSYLQSYKYFENIKNDLVNINFQFQDNVQHAAEDLIATVRRERGIDDITVVGMHVRRGDFVRQIRRGYGVATKPYLYRAMNYFTRKYKHVVFIITSNDIYWCLDNIKGPYDLHFSHINDGAVDLAVLVHCDHVIITTGSFSWWAGYLNKGETIYYPGYPVDGTWLAEKYVKIDYFPPWWKAI